MDISPIWSFYCNTINAHGIMLLKPQQQLKSNSYFWIFFRYLLRYNLYRIKVIHL